MRWAETGKFGSIDAYDLSASSIKYAIQAANSSGYGSVVNYRVGDVFGIERREGHYDVVLGEQSLHHFSPLEEILQLVSSLLKPDGYLIVNEFVGPTRFQWTDPQLEKINGLLSILPVKYRTLWGSESTKQEIWKPSRLSLMFGDPSEAVESSDIVGLLDRIFEAIEVKAYGGTILHMLFHGIAHNFLSEDSETKRWIDVCCEVEDLLLASGEIRSDFVVAISRKRG